MSLRTRLFLVFGALMGLLVTAEWALVTALTHDLEQEVAEVAFEAGAEVLGSFFPEVKEDRSPSGGFFLHHGDGHHPLSKAFVLGSREGNQGIDELFGPLRERMHRAEGIAVFEQTEIVRRVEADRPTRSVRLRLPDTRDLAESDHVLVLSLCEPELTGGRVIGIRGGHGLELRSTSFQIHMHLAEVAGQGVVGQGLVGTTSAGGIAIGVAVDEEDVEVELAPPAGQWRPQASPVAAGGTVSADGSDALDAAPADAGGPLTVEIPISSEGIDRARRTWLRRVLIGSGAILGLGLLVAGWLAHRVTRPLRELSGAAREVGAGALGTQVLESGDREMGEAIGAFNQMSTRLAALDAEARSLREREHLTEIGEMARGLAHAMRNPLHLLGLSVEQLAGNGDPGNAQLAESARSQIQRIDQSLRSFLALSSGGAGAHEEVSVEDLARDVALEMVQQGASGVRVEIESRGPCTLRAVSAELRAVLHVLVVNAVEASPPGGEVLVRVLCGDDQVTVEVLDRGPGLAAEVRARLFTPHVTTKEQGAGMGLFLAQRIATSRYGGGLSLADREDGGTRAVLELGDRGDTRG